MDLKGNAGESKRKTDEKIWRENEYMGRLLGDKVKELDKRKTKLERKLKKDQEKFAVQHLSVTNSTDKKVLRRKKISLTTEPYKFIQAASEDGNKDSRSIEHLGWQLNSKQEDHRSRSTSVPNLAQLGERNEPTAKKGFFLPPISNNKLQLSTIDQESLTNLSAAKVEGESNQNFKSKILACNDSRVVSSYGTARPFDNEETKTVQAPRLLRNTRRQGDEGTTDVFLTDDSIHSKIECKPRGMKYEQDAQLFGQMTMNESTIIDIYDSPLLPNVTINKPNNKRHEYNTTLRSGSVYSTYEQNNTATKADLEPLERPHSIVDVFSDLQGRKRLKSRKVSSTTTADNNALSESSGTLTVGFGNISRVDMVKNLNKKRQMELEHQISFLPPTNRMFSDNEADLNNCGKVLNENDTKRLGNAKKRWLKAYNMAKQNFYGQNQSPNQMEKSNLKSSDENKKRTHESYSKDPRLLSLVSMLHKCKSICSTKETEPKIHKDLA